MRKLAVSSLVLAAMTGGALAADLPVRTRAPAISQPPIVVAMNWTGLYLGAQAGYSWGKNDVCQYFSGVLFPTSCRDLGADSFVGGLHAGYNVQFGQFVLGIEGDVESARRNESDSWGGANGYSFETRSNWQASLRGRAGYAFERALIYVTGGVAYAPRKHTYVALQDAVAIQFSSRDTGWTLGGGLEYAFASNWTARVEYRYTDWGTITDTAPTGITPRFDGVSYRHEPSDQTVRVGLSYLFNAGPVVARY
jgi:outer membrane immunogenic protein